MGSLPQSLDHHRVRGTAVSSVTEGEVRWSPAPSLWFTGMAIAAIVGGAATFSWAAFALFVVATGVVLLFGHSLGSHRKLVHDSFQCPRWLEYLLVYLGVQVGLAGPIGLLRQHELRDYAQRLPDCHPFLRHGRGALVDAWWQLHCELVLANPPALRIEPRIADDRFYQWLERTWMWQQVPPALLFYLWGGWGFVFFGVCARVTAGVFGHWLIGYLAHNRGGMHHEVRGAAVQGRNIRWTSLLTMGECWHNNHHAFPGSARLGLYAGEWDPGWWALRALERVRLVRALRLPVDLPPRPELARLEPEGPAAAPGLRTMLRWVLLAAREDTAELTWPARRLGEAALRRIVGPRTVAHRDREARRLSLRRSGQTVHGLPALCIAMAHGRSGCAGLLAAGLLPLTMVVEGLRR